MGDLTTIFITLIGVLGSAAAWDYYKKRLDNKTDEEKSEKADKNLYRDDLKLRVSKLEDQLLCSGKENNILRDKVTILTAQVASLTTKVAYLTVEVDKLEQENKSLKWIN